MPQTKAKTLTEALRGALYQPTLKGRLYDTRTGAVAVQCGHDGDEDHYEIFRYDVINSRWYSNHKLVALPKGDWADTEQINWDEKALMDIASEAYDAAR